MHFTDVIHNHLTGDAREQERRSRLLQELLAAFSRGGGESMQKELVKRMDALGGALDDKLEALRAKF